MRVPVMALALLALTAVPGSALSRGNASGGDDSLSVTLRGRWKVGPVVDPSRQPMPADLAAQLARARLPLPGEVVRSEAGKLCVGSVPCDDVAWTETTFANSEYGEGMRKALGLSARTPVYQGDTGNRLISYTLFARPDRTLMALVSLCQDSYRARGCRAAFEIWHPLSPDARMRPTSHRR